MSLVAFEGVIDHEVLNGNFEDKERALATAIRDGRKDHTIYLRHVSATSATVLSGRTIAWIQPDDAELRLIYARGTASAGSSTLVATLTGDLGATRFLVDRDVTATATATSAATFDSRPASGSFATLTGTRLRLLKGARYRLTFEITGASTWTNITVGVQGRTYRRKA